MRERSRKVFIKFMCCWEYICWRLCIWEGKIIKMKGNKVNNKRRRKRINEKEKEDDKRIKFISMVSKLNG